VRRVRSPALVSRGLPSASPDCSVPGDDPRERADRGVVPEPLHPAQAPGHGGGGALPEPGQGPVEPLGIELSEEPGAPSVELPNLRLQGPDQADLRGQVLGHLGEVAALEPGPQLHGGPGAGQNLLGLGLPPGPPGGLDEHGGQASPPQPEHAPRVPVPAQQGQRPLPQLFSQDIVHPRRGQLEEGPDPLAVPAPLDEGLPDVETSYWDTEASANAPCIA
jgi:hypothetical protein